MPALDTNVPVRFVVRHDGARWAAARRLIKACVDEGQSLFVPAAVVLEFEWVLCASYGRPKDEVIHVLASLFSAAERRFESEQALEVALQLYREVERT